MITRREYKIPKIRLAYVADYTVDHPKIRTSNEIADFLRHTYEDGEIDYRECFKIVYLNRSNNIIGCSTIAEGSTAMCPVDMKMIFTGALLSNAHGIVLCHNHPSGSLLPSYQDDNLTTNVNKAAELLDIKVLDHVILTSRDHYSYRDNGRIL